MEISDPGNEPEGSEHTKKGLSPCASGLGRPRSRGAPCNPINGHIDQKQQYYHAVWTGWAVVDWSIGWSRSAGQPVQGCLSSKKKKKKPLQFGPVFIDVALVSPANRYCTVHMYMRLTQGYRVFQICLPRTAICVGDPHKELEQGYPICLRKVPTGFPI